MKSTFDQLLNEYKQLLEQDGDPAAGAPAGAPPPSPSPAGAGAPPDPMGAGAGAQPPQPPPKNPSSTGYAVLAQLVLDALKTPVVRDKEDIRFSDNTIRTPQEAYQYLNVIKRNLASDSQGKLQGDMGKSNDNKVPDLDTSELIYLAQLGLKALFYTRKDEKDSQFNDVASIVKVDTDNAKEIIEKIRSLLSGVEKE
jgi:hypothetical protein